MIAADDAPLLAVFAAVVQRGSFSAAATQLRLSRSVVSERVKLLEERCGSRLLERTTRRLRLTEAGAEVLEASRRIEDTLSALSASLDARRGEPSGTLRIATTNDLGPSLVAPVVARLLTAHPRVRVELLSNDAVKDVLEAGVDVAVRLGTPRSSSFVSRRLAVLAEPIVAAPWVVDQIGAVTRPAELANAPWVRHALVTSSTLRFTGPGGAVDEFAPRVCVEADAGPTVLGLLLAGAGVGVLPDHLVREHLHTGRLRRLCPGWVWKQITLYALTPSRSTRPVVRRFLALLQEQVALDRLRWSDEPGSLP